MQLSLRWSLVGRPPPAQPSAASERLRLANEGLTPIEKEVTTTEQAKAEPETEHIQESTATMTTTLVEAITEKEKSEATTETNLRLVNTELEKLLTEAAKRE